ncbi:CASP8 and FADD-like apoptosis regulator [Melanotaenia boesemani]|uniref:CASP8 and FADD-like apoptosis regulator n=1 Tax=Melanotaenia boesemani TaxID=1250792 RepID=UPI001C04E395|nr:CASP8 and FADD-like apoptosis regulator [Melanotaenia boesemani]
MSMALLDQRHLKEISQIVDALDCSERRKLLYLCGSFDTDTSGTFVKDFLKSKFQDHENSTLFLVELTWRLERFDILRRVYKITRKEVEETLKYTQVLSKFRVLMVSISEDVDKEDLDKIKFLLSNTLSREKMKATETFLDMLIELEKLDSLSPERLDNVQKCFMNIGRVDLAKKLVAYKMSAEASGQHSSQQQVCRARETAQGATHHNAGGSVPLSVSREPSSRNQLEQYNFNTNPKGVCVIIDCVGNDGGMLEQTFNALHFKVILYQWLSADEILSALRGLFSKRENHPGDGFACCIISRGTANHLLGTDLNGSGLPIDSIRHVFTAEVCPILVGKPKLFFIQRYNVPEYEPCARMSHWDGDVEPDGFNGPIMHNCIPTDSDIFWSHCWTDERQLEQEQQSIYLKALTDALNRAKSRKTHLVEAHMEVNGAIFEHNKRNAGADYHIDLRHTLRKNLYLD